jgi:imidazolonepropionase-like amidohydrolase
MDADLTVIAADPAEKIEALAEVVYTIRAGRVIFGPGR